MPDSRRFLPPELVTRLGRLELQARSIVEGLLAGRHRSPFCGQSVEFVQHRQYSWGDELRHVDWRVWARHDRLYVKQFEENTNLRLTLMVDASASMSYGQVGATKFDCAATLAACLAYLVLRQQDDVACVTFDQRIRHRATHRNHWGHLETILSILDQSDPQEKTSLLPPVLEAASLFPQKGIWVIVSDLLIEPEELGEVLRFLRSRGQEVVVFHVLHEDELDFPFSVPSIFEDCETALRIRCTPAAFRQGYLEALTKYLGHVREVCSQLQTEYYLVRRSEPLELPLLKFLAGRSRLMGGRLGRRKP